MEGKIGHDMAHTGIGSHPQTGVELMLAYINQVEGKIGHDMAHAGVPPPPADRSGTDVSLY